MHVALRDYTCPGNKAKAFRSDKSSCTRLPPLPFLDPSRITEVLFILPSGASQQTYGLTQVYDKMAAISLVFENLVNINLVKNLGRLSSFDKYTPLTYPPNYCDRILLRYAHSCHIRQGKGVGHFLFCRNKDLFQGSRSLLKSCIHVAIP